METSVNPQSLHDRRLRNLLRGAQANDKPQVRRKTINNARQMFSPSDAQKFTQLMCETDLDEFYYGPTFPDSPTSIYRTPFRKQVSLKVECAVQSARLRHNLQRLRSASVDLGRINSTILSGDLLQACSLCRDFIAEFGYSAALARKCIYINLLATSNHGEVDDTDYKKQANELLRPFFITDPSPLYAQFVNLTIDVCDRDVDCLETRKEHLRLLRDSIPKSDKFPPHYAMMKRMVSPTSYHSIVNTVSLLFFSSSSAIDLLVDLCIARDFGSALPLTLQEVFAQEDFQYACENLQPSSQVIGTFLELPHIQGAEQAAYRASAIFPEISTFARWRHAIDYEFRARDNLPLLTEPSPEKMFPSDLHLVDLCKRGSKSFYTFSYFDNAAAGSFLRTVAVLNCIRRGDSLSSLAPEAIRILLSQTTGFSRLLHERELVELRDHSEREDADVVVFLTMVMMNQRDPNEDLAFEMRMTFQMVIMRSHNSNIIEFLDWLYIRTASLCTVVVDLCDIAFLERLYLINSTYADVLTTREEMCRWTARKFDLKEYESIADRLALDSKVRTIREGIDEARIFVDVLRFKQWALDSLSPTLRKFERVVSVAPVTMDETPTSTSKRASEKEAPVSSSDFWFYVASEKAFLEFCHNKLFGIDSYLSRRIRHGTLAGTLVVPIQTKILEFEEVLGNSGAASDAKTLKVLGKYKSIVERIRDELLHFRTKDKPKGLFIPSASTTSTRTSIQQEFRNRIVQFFQEGYSASEICPLFLNHCWDLLTEDLFRVQYELRNIFTKEIRPLLRSLAAGRTDVAWRSLVADLDQTAEGLFGDLLRWFAKSEGSAMTVSVKELVAVVVQEVSRYFPEYEQRYRFVRGGDESLSGLTYQTVYDLLSLFFTNIAQHGDPRADTEISSQFGDYDSSGSAMLNIQIVSKILESVSDDSVRKAIADSLMVSNHEESMVREGKSGLGKAMALVRAHSGERAFSWDVCDRRCIVEFRVPVIVVAS